MATTIFIVFWVVIAAFVAGWSFGHESGSREGAERERKMIAPRFTAPEETQDPADWWKKEA